MSMSKMLFAASIAGACGLWYWYCVREERAKKDEQARLDLQRGAMGFKPGAGKYPASTASRSTIRKRCPRGVCTTPGASCPRECVQAPKVKRLVDGRLVHEYDDVEVTFGSAGNILELNVDGRAWN
jgi:hypothetical protein